MLKIVAIPFSIIGIADESQPGFVECKFQDADGAAHRFIEKVPVVTRQNVSHESIFPILDSLRCVEEGMEQDSKGRSVSIIDIARPWGIKTSDGTIFRVFTSTLSTIING